MSFKSELKEFLMRGNVVDMAVGIVIGGAFGKIVTSFVNDILMPPIAAIVGDGQFGDLSVTLKQAVMEGAEIVTPAITWNYGSFIQAVIDIIVTSIFMVIKGMNSFKKKEEPAPEAAPEPTKEETLLTEIRDLLKKDK